MDISDPVEPGDFDKSIHTALGEGEKPKFFELQFLWWAITNSVNLCEVSFACAPQFMPGTAPTTRQPPPRRPPPWYLGMSHAFSKAIVEIDSRLQGKILEALTVISADPMTPRGDTIKALQGDLKGCWRYRIRDFRLVYKPYPETGDILLLAFESRASVYE